MSSPLKIAVVGLGAVAQSVHLPLIRRRPDLFELVAITDLSTSLTAKVGEAFGVAAEGQFADFDQLLQHPNLDAVLVCSGGSHEGIVVAALNRGLAVLCEKPLAFTLSEIAAIRAALPTSGPPRLMVGYMKQYDPAVARAAEILSTIDDIRTIDVTVLHPTGRSQLEFAHVLAGNGDVDAATLSHLQAEDNRLRTIALGAETGAAADALWRVYAGCLMSSLSHDMSVIRRLTGGVESVDFVDIWRQRSTTQVRETGRDTAALGEWPPSIRVAGRLEGESRFVLDWHYLPDYPAYRETVRIVHGAGSLELEFPSPYLLNAPTTLTTFALTGDAEARTVFRSIDEAFELELEEFANMVNRGTQPLTGIDGAENDIKTSQMIVARFAESPHGGLGTLGGEAAHHHRVG
jgi:myo-inositol 2-dehydrogenase/D-chiro-inositol 1-dehydrogenase